MRPAFSTSACLSVPLKTSLRVTVVFLTANTGRPSSYSRYVSGVRLELPLGQGLFSGTVLFHFLKSHALLQWHKKHHFFERGHEVSLRLCARNPRCVLVLEFMVFGDQRHPDALEFRQIFAEALLEL